MRAMLVLAVLASGCVGAPYSALILAPAHYDAGVVSTHGAVGTHLEAALSSAALSKRPGASYDIGVGYQADLLPGPAPAQSVATAARATQPPAPETVTTALYGPFVELARRVAGTRHQRVFAGLRGEAFLAGDRGYAGPGIAARVSWELFGTGSNGSGNGILYYGSYGVGLFMETSVRDLGVVETAGIVGLTFRVPATILPKR